MTKKDRTLPSYVYQLRNRYYVAQTVNKEQIIYGRYDTREEAVQRRNQLVNDGVIKHRRGKHRIKNYEDRYLTNKKGRYYIQKCIDGKITHFGILNSLEEARRERDYLESIEWDYGNMY